MADISQIKIGNTTYDICDTTARNSIPSTKNNVEITKYKRFDLAPKTISSAACSTVHYGNYAQFTLPSYPTWGLLYVDGEGYFVATTQYSNSDPHKVWYWTEVSIEYRAQSTDSWSPWQKKKHESYLAWQQFQWVYDGFSPIASRATGHQICIGGCHNNYGSKYTRDLRFTGHICILYGQPASSTKDFTSSGTDNITITYN